jgi:hypothetical protein
MTAVQTVTVVRSLCSLVDEGFERNQPIRSSETATLLTSSFSHLRKEMRGESPGSSAFSKRS